MEVRIAGRSVGSGHPCLIIAEAGSNHSGRLEHARRLVDVAAEAGADAVKFQVFRADRLYARSAGASDYLKVDRPIHEIIAEMEMPYDWLGPLSEHCRQRNVLFLASVFDEESADRLDPYVEAFKIASYELTHLPLIKYVVAKGKPMIMSTGAADRDEVTETVEAVQAAGVSGLILMQCTAAYPAPVESLNLRTIPAMKAAFGVPVGLSDHSRDPLVGPLCAVALGADAVEKHFTFSNELPGPDHRFALEPDELRVMIRKIRECERALGDGRKTVHAVETELRAFARRGIFAIRDIPRGQPLSRDNVAVLRCGKLQGALPPRELDSVLGNLARRDIAADSPIKPGDYV